MKGLQEKGNRRDCQGDREGRLYRAYKGDREGRLYRAYKGDREGRPYHTRRLNRFVVW